MNLTERSVAQILKQVAKRKLTSRRALEKLRYLPYETLRFARLDHHRSFRKGFPEAVFAPGKSLRQLEKIITAVRRSGHGLLVTRLEAERYKALRKKFSSLRYSEEAKIGFCVNGLTDDDTPRNKGQNVIAVLTGGTSDLAVAEEAAVTLELMGRRVVRLYDCGVAGLHRLLDQLPQLRRVKAIVCIAGMEGALASVVAGLVDRPVIAVPTSVGYGASFKGLAALLTMLNSCAEGVAVVNIDNGFGAACFAATLTQS